MCRKYDSMWYSSVLSSTLVCASFTWTNITYDNFTFRFYRMKGECCRDMQDSKQDELSIGKIKVHEIMIYLDACKSWIGENKLMTEWFMLLAYLLTKQAAFSQNRWDCFPMPGKVNVSKTRTNWQTERHTSFSFLSFFFFLIFNLTISWEYYVFRQPPDSEIGITRPILIMTGFLKFC